MIKRLVIAVILLAIVAGGVVGFNMFRDQAIRDFFATRTAPAVPVETVVAEAGPWVPVLDAIGTVFARRGIELAVEGSGVVREVNFNANDPVGKDQVLVKIADEVERAELAAAKAQVRLAEQTLARLSSLGERGVAAESSIEEAEAALATAGAQVHRIEAVLDQKVVVAPFNGVIGIPAVEEGQYVTAGAKVATLQDLERLRVDFSVPEQDLPRIELGQPVEIVAETGARATGFITGIEPRVDPTSRLVAVRAEIDNRDGVLSPGQFVRVNVVLPAEEGVIALPQTAVVTSLYGDYVYAVAESEEEDGEQDGATPALVAKQLFVKTGLRQGDRVAIAEGVDAGARIVIAGQNRLSNGTPVTLSEGPAAGEDEAAPEAPSVAGPQAGGAAASAPAEAAPAEAAQEAEVAAPAETAPAGTEPEAEAAPAEAAREAEAAE